MTLLLRDRIAPLVLKKGLQASIVQLEDIEYLKEAICKSITVNGYPVMPIDQIYEKSYEE